MLRAAFTSVLAWCPQAVHTNSAWLLREFLSTCLQVLQVCDVYAGLIFWTRPGALCSSRVTSWLQPAARMPRFSPAFWRTLRPGLAVVPRAERVMLLTRRSSTLITSNERARVVDVVSTQSVRRSVCRAVRRARAVFVRAPLDEDEGHAHRGQPHRDAPSRTTLTQRMLALDRCFAAHVAMISERR